MAKRGGSELNHENWDQDVETESAGVFKKAPVGEIQGRVIRKARRRNVGDDPEKKNAFSGFGGFTAAQPAGESFSFLKSPATDSPSSGGGGGFAFGSPSSGGAEPAKPSFSSFMTSKPAGPVKPSFGSFVFNSAATDGTKDQPKIAPFSVSENKPTESNGTKPAFGDTGGFTFGAADTDNKPGGGFAFGASSASSGSGFAFGAPSKSTTEPEAKSSFVFGAKSCATPPPKDDKPASAGFGFGSTNAPTEKLTSTPFSFGKSSSPKPTAVALPAFSKGPTEKSTFSIGSTEKAAFSTGSTEKSAFSMGLSSDKSDKPVFSFGAKSSDDSPKKETTGFSFGSSKIASIESKPSSGMFGTSAPSSFVNGQASSNSAFGKSTESSTAFGSKSSENSAAFGSKSTDSSTPKEASRPFGSKPVTNNVEDTPEYDEDYLAHLKALNVQVTEWIKKHVDDNPLVILSPIFKDYEKHIQEIADKFPPRATRTPSLASASPKNKSPVKTTEAIKPFSFGAKAAPTEKESAAPTGFSFGSGPAAKPAAAAAPGGFSFGSGSGGMFSAPPIPSSTQPAPSTENAQGEDEDQPPKVEIKQVTEDDALYSKKCKLFYKKDGNYVEKGVGMMYLKTADSGKIQLLMRADTNLGNILLNIILNKDIPTTRVGKNNVMLVCIPNPPVDPKATTSQPTPMLIRVKTSADADDLKDKLDEYKTK